MWIVFGDFDLDERSCCSQHLGTLGAEVTHPNPFPGILVTLRQTAERFHARHVTNLGFFEIDDDLIRIVRR